jgi:hypothetical protein
LVGAARSDSQPLAGKSLQWSDLSEVRLHAPRAGYGGSPAPRWRFSMGNEAMFKLSQQIDA